MENALKINLPESSEIPFVAMDSEKMVRIAIVAPAIVQWSIPVAMALPVSLSDLKPEQ